MCITVFQNRNTQMTVADFTVWFQFQLNQGTVIHFVWYAPNWSLKQIESSVKRLDWLVEGGLNSHCVYVRWQLYQSFWNKFIS